MIHSVRVGQLARFLPEFEDWSRAVSVMVIGNLT